MEFASGHNPVGTNRSKGRYAGIGLYATYLALALSIISIGNVARAANAPEMATSGQTNVSQTGAFTYGIPIEVPPGSGGMAPSISLNYSSQNGDNIAGLGWTISGLPSIGRCPRTLAQDPDPTTSNPVRYIHGAVTFQTTDRYCFGSQRLVPIGSGSGTVSYRTEVEGFSDITAVGTAGQGPLYFKVRTKSGQTLYLGWSEDTDNSGNGSRLVIPTDNTTGREWAVEKIVDAVGNYLIVKYTDDTANAQIRPSTINYTLNKTAGLTTAPVAITFHYLSRTDSGGNPIRVPTYLAGTRSQITDILEDIQVSLNGTRVLYYKPVYSAPIDGSQHYQLQSFQKCDGSTTTCLNMLHFGWQGGTGTVSFSQSPATGQPRIRSPTLPI